MISSNSDKSILFINTIEKQGGAARAAYRIFRGIHKIDKRTLYLTLFKESKDNDIFGLIEHSIRGKIASFMIRFEYYPLKLYKLKENVTFTPSFISNPFRFPINNFNPKLVHLHWLGFSYMRIEDLKKYSCPIVWTLHDQWAFTGGCHYSGECSKYEDGCGQCPQLNSSKQNDITYKLIQRKKKTYNKLNLTIVTPSQWLANLAKKSSLLKDFPIEVIPNGLDTQVFKPIDHKAAKDYFGFNDNRPVLLFSAHSLTDPRKGSDLMIQALKKLDFPFILLSFGIGELKLSDLSHVTYKSLGSPVDDLSLVMAYSAADVYLCPTREDNLPNVVAEALACGTPCVAFNVGGLPEMIDHKENGYLAKAFDTGDFSQGIRYLLADPEPDKFRESARKKALEEYDINIATKRYWDLYQKILS